MATFFDADDLHALESGMGEWTNVQSPVRRMLLTMATALEVAAKAPKGSTVLCMIPDTGERYLSTPLFADIGADMNDSEVAISHSTPSGHVESE